jgi:hypothetical protein
MAQHIARCLAWVRDFLALRTPPGRHRAVPGAGSARTPRTVIVRAWDPPYLPWVRRTRAEERIDGDATAMVRPYLVAEEQRQRRRALLLATLGVDDPGPYWIHGVEVA